MLLICVEEAQRSIVAWKAKWTSSTLHLAKHLEAQPVCLLFSVTVLETENYTVMVNAVIP